MAYIPSIIAIGIASFAATNIDDIFVLMMFFSSSSSSSSSSSLTFPSKQIVLGQYIGIGLLIAISALGSFISLVIPTYIIGLLGIVPIGIGVKKLIELRNKDEDKMSYSQNAVQRKNKSYLSFLAVAAVTFSNGGDNIGVYTPMFAKYNSASQITALVAVLMAMTAVWCIAAYYLVNHPLIASKIGRTGRVVLPFVLIGLGIYIMSESFLFVYEIYGYTSIEDSLASDIMLIS
jgi:cadmium resistance protein CadD (predicted permease)